VLGHVLVPFIRQLLEIGRQFVELFHHLVPIFGQTLHLFVRLFDLLVLLQNIVVGLLDRLFVNLDLFLVLLDLVIRLLEVPGQIDDLELVRFDRIIEIVFQSIEPLDFRLVEFQLPLLVLDDLGFVMNSITQLLNLFVQFGVAHPLVGDHRAEAQREENQQILQKVFHDALFSIPLSKSQLLKQKSKSLPFIFPLADAFEHGEARFLGLSNRERSG